MSSQTIPIADSSSVRHAASRERRVRIVLVLAGVVLLSAAILLASRGPAARPAAAGSDSGPVTEIILDVSGSVGASSSSFAGKTLARLGRSGGRVGLILFSDVAQEALPPGTQARSSAAQAREDAKQTDQFISFLQNFLLAFGGVALFVGSFVIANSLSITIAQRTREFATLRTLGASRRQVLRSIIVEALVIGVLASVLGLFAGLLLAKGLFALFDAVGFTLPNSGLTLVPRTVVVSLAVYVAGLVLLAWEGRRDLAILLAAVGGVALSIATLP